MKSRSPKLLALCDKTRTCDKIIGARVAGAAVRLNSNLPSKRLQVILIGNLRSRNVLARLNQAVQTRALIPPGETPV
jgi:hypothetical protein